MISWKYVSNLNIVPAQLSSYSHSTKSTIKIHQLYSIANNRTNEINLRVMNKTKNKLFYSLRIQALEMKFKCYPFFLCSYISDVTVLWRLYIKCIKNCNWRLFNTVRPLPLIFPYSYQIPLFWVNQNLV